MKPQPGDFGLSRRPTRYSKWINFGQFIIGDMSRYDHAFIVLDDDTVMEARPSGAGIVPLSYYLGNAVFSDLELTEDQRRLIVMYARELEGTKYSFMSYLYLGLSHFGVQSQRLINYIVSSGRMICSQLVDHVYELAGVHLFDDGRKHHDVTPGDLTYMLLERHWVDYNTGKLDRPH
jgi:uncharacterized protein YycO